MTNADAEVLKQLADHIRDCNARYAALDEKLDKLISAYDAGRGVLFTAKLGAAFLGAAAAGATAWHFLVGAAR